MMDHVVRDAFGVLSCPFWSMYCSALWCMAADTHLKLLDCAVCSASFLNGGVFECDIPQDSDRTF